MTNIVSHSGNKIVVEGLGLKARKPIADILGEKGIKIVEKFDKGLIVLLDGSGSMASNMGDVSKIQVAYDVLDHELLPNMAGWDYGILIFHGWDDTHWLSYPGLKNTSGLALRPKADGGTPMLKGLITAWNYARQGLKEARFILLSDGEPTDGTKAEILQHAREHATIPIDTIGIGTDTEYSGGYDPIFLRELSRITGGVFTEVGSVKALSDTILKLSPMKRPVLGPVR